MTKRRKSVSESENPSSALLMIVDSDGVWSHPRHHLHRSCGPWWRSEDGQTARRDAGAEVKAHCSDWASPDSAFLGDATSDSCEYPFVHVCIRNCVNVKAPL